MKILKDAADAMKAMKESAVAGRYAQGKVLAVVRTLTTVAEATGEVNMDVRAFARVMLVEIAKILDKPAMLRADN